MFAPPTIAIARTYSANTTNITSLENTEYTATTNITTESNNNDNDNLKPFIFLVYQFTPTEIVVFVSVISIVSVFTTVANATVVHLTRTSPELRPMGSIRFIIGSMACADLLMGLVIMPLSCQLNVLREWVLTPFGCKLFLSSTPVSVGSSLMHLCAIATDRYLAMIHPLRYRQLASCPWYPKWIIVGIWIAAVLSATPCFFFELGLTWTDEEGRVFCDATQHAGYITPLLSAVIGLPFVFIWSIYLKLYCANRSRLEAKLRKTLRTYQQLQMSNASEMNGSSSKMSPEHRNGARLLLSVDPLIACVGCQARVPSSALKSGLCKICRAPNDLIIAAVESKLKELMDMNRRMLLVTLIIVSTFTFCFVPFFAVFQILVMSPETQISPWLITMSMWLAWGNSAFNPIIYAAFNRSFRKAFKRFIGCD